VGQELEHGQIENFDAKALLIRAKIKLRLRISKIFFIYTLCSWIICVKYKN
jgi:hypothetical protein